MITQGKYIYKNKDLVVPVQTQQNQYFLDKLEQIILSVNPERIVEIGTARGGVTLAMSDILNKNNLSNAKIKTFDINTKDHLQNLPITNIEFYVGNIFVYKDESLLYPAEITNFLSKKNPNLILCDGGFKIKEFNTLCKYLKKGDVIMAHDYAPNKEVFESEYKDKIWNWMEITDSDIEKSVKEYNLEYYKMDLIKPSAWVSFVKV